LDADCIVGKNWLKEYENNIRNDVVSGSVIVSGKEFIRIISTIHLGMRRTPQKNYLITLKNFGVGGVPLGGNCNKKYSIRNGIYRFILGEQKHLHDNY